MPITPWHVGPGLVFKAALGPRISLLTFTVAQGVMDVPVVYRILNQISQPHAYSTTFVGALAMAPIAVVITMPFVRVMERYVLRTTKEKPFVTWSAAWLGAFAGTLSHLALDAVMHSDAFPFWPISRWNPLHLAVNIQVLHDVCFWSFAVGGVGWAVVAAFRHFKQSQTSANDADVPDSPTPPPGE